MTPNKLPKGTVKYLSERLKDEYNANRFYRYASNCLKSVGYFVAADYFAKEAVEEMEHARGLQDYAADWNNELDFLALESVEETEGIIDIVNHAYEIEWALLKKYKENSMDAWDEGDLSTFNFLKKYVDIQTQSVIDYSDKLNMLALFDSADKNWLFDNEKKLFK